MKKSQFQFTKPILDKVIFKVSDEQIEAKNVQIQHEIGVRIEDLVENEKEKRVHLEVKLGSPKLDTGEIDVDAFPFYIEVKMQATFLIGEIQDEGLVNELLQKNAPVLLLSYIRPIVHNLSSMSKFPPYDIPFLDFTSSDINEEENRDSIED